MKKKLPSLGTVLLYLAAAFQSTQYARAFHVIDSSSAWSDIGGLIAGIVVNMSLAYSASRLPRLRKKYEQRFSYIAFWALVIMTPIFLAPINYKTMGDLWSESVTLRWVLAGISASLVDIAIALVAFSDGSLVSLGATQSEPTATESAPSAEGSATKKKRTADALRSECAALSAQYACTEPPCVWSPSVDALIASAQKGKSARSAAASAKAGHMKNQHPKPILIDQSLLIGGRKQ